MLDLLAQTKKSPAMKSIQMTLTVPPCQPAMSPDTAIHPEIAYKMIRLRRRRVGAVARVAERVLRSGA